MLNPSTSSFLSTRLSGPSLKHWRCSRWDNRPGQVLVVYFHNSRITTSISSISSPAPLSECPAMSLLWRYWSYFLILLFLSALTPNIIRLTPKLATLRELWRSFRIIQATSKWSPGTSKTIRKPSPGSPGTSKTWTSLPIRFSLTEQSLTQTTLGLLILSTEKEERNLLTSRSFTNSK